MKKANSLFIISGEASGDMHAANMAKELLVQNPDLKIKGWGGDKMRESGVEILKHYRELAFMGFYEVLKNLPQIFRNFKLVKKQILETNPKLVVLVDYPGFNLRLLPWLKEKGFKVIYYIAPQAWAWKEGRVKKMARYIDELLVILPFEEEFFSQRGVQTEFVGHPLLQLKIKNGRSKTEKRIVLLPGSRKQEVRHILPEMLSVLDNFPDYEFVIAGMSHLGESIYKQIIGDKRVRLLFDKSEELISTADIALVSSGTATLQTALASVPQIVCYKSGRLNYELGKRLIKVPYISLVNLIMQRGVVKELIQEDLNKTNLLREMKSLLVDEKREQQRKDYSDLKELLGKKNASKRTAEIILAKINQI